MGLHVYVHVPFCITKCRSCAFVSIAAQEIPEDRYISAILDEARGRTHAMPPGQTIATLYLGGGTPTLLSSESVARLIEGLNRLWPLSPSTEVSIEANPETITLPYARALRAIGINRVSLGVQSFSDRLLAYIGRVHDAERSIRAYDELREAGFDNVNVDIMYAIPTETFEDLIEDLFRLQQLKSEHVSAYMFQHETPSSEHVAPYPDELSARSFFMVIASLEECALMQYEISNFAQPGRECRHNLAYWSYQPYLGLGAAAVSCLEEGLRFQNDPDPYRYMHTIEQGLSPVSSLNRLSPDDIVFEKRFLSLRTVSGIAAQDMPADIPADLFTIKDGRAVLTPKGMLLSNEIFARL